MIAVDEPALVCDFAQVYNVIDYRALPARRAALLACGLGPGSRIQLSLSGAAVPPELMLLAAIADGINLLVWQNTKDGHKNRNRPASILEGLHRKEPEEPVGFESAADFDAWRASMIER